MNIIMFYKSAKEKGAFTLLSFNTNLIRKATQEETFFTNSGELAIDFINSEQVYYFNNKLVDKEYKNKIIDIATIFKIEELKNLRCPNTIVYLEKEINVKRI